MWNFADLRACLLPLAEELLSDVNKIMFAREFDIKDWLVPAHVKLCQRAEPLTTDEATKLGLHSLLMISRMREQPRGTLALGSGYYCKSCSGGFISATNYGAPCKRCGSRSTSVYYEAPATIIGNSTPGSATIEDRVKKWVTDGCVLTE